MKSVNAIRSKNQVRGIISLSLLLFCFLTSDAQDPKEDSLAVLKKSIFVIQPQIHVGKLVKIYPTFPSSNVVNLNEINFALQTRGKREWNQLYGYPQIGIALIYGYWGNNNVLGNNIALVPNLAFDTHNNSRWRSQTRFGLGFTYFTKHYDAINNPTNNVIGASITNLTFLSEDLYYNLTARLKINIGISIFHSSDGHYQLPNLGANIPSVNIGIRYSPDPLPGKYKYDSVAKPNKKMLLNFFAGYGRHEFGSATKPTGGPKYPVFQAAMYISKRYKKISNFQAGVSYAYYTDYYDFIVNQEYFDSHLHLKASVVTAFIGNEFMIGKFGLIAQSGINVYSPFLKKYNQEHHDTGNVALYISNKIGIQYYIFDPTLRPRHNIYVGVYMKAHFGTADYAQVGLGTTF